MIKFFQRRFALSENGARSFLKGVIFTTLFDVALMLPAIYIFLFLQDYLAPMFGTAESFSYGVLYYIAMGAGFMLILFVFAKLQYRNTYTTVYEESANRRIGLAEKLRALPLAFFGEKNLSDLTSTIMQDCTELEHIFSHAVPQLFGSFISMVIISIGMFFYNWKLTLALLWVAPVAALIMIITKVMINRKNKTMYLSKRDVTEKIQEGLDMVQEIKSYNQEDKYLHQLDAKIDDYEKELIGGELVTGALLNSAQSVLRLGFASVVIIGAKMVAESQVDLFTYFVYLIIGARFYNPIQEVFNNLAVLFFLDVRIDRVNEMEALPIQQGKTELKPDYFDIEFQDVEFSYETGKKVLKGVSFTAKQGEITALIGPSGGGKSTSAKLSARFWDIESGKILLGGQDISEIDPETLLQYYSVVFQNVVLFNASIMDNIRIGKRDASDDEVRHVAKLAQCEEFINKMPQGYETIIGENGETLSGGERQRISIARALLKNAPIVLLDEATASIDVENETKIQAGISELVRDKTVLIIAHRMRTIADSDKIVVLDNGKVSESGRPSELRKKNGVFAKMLTAMN